MMAAEVRMRSWTLATAVVIFLSSSHGAFAQDPTPKPQGTTANPQDPAQKPPAAVGEAATKPTRGFFSSLGHNLKDDVKHLPRKNSLYFLVAGGAAAAAIHPWDEEINDRLAGSGAAETFFKPGKYIGNTAVLLGAGTATYLIGRGKHSGRLQHLGMDEIEGQLLAGAIVVGLKQSVRRDRPIKQDGTQNTGFAFPSGHAASTFAAATILQQHLGYKAGIPTYLVATYVAMSRLHDEVHSASDVVFGATIGLVVGRTVTWHGRNFYASPMLLPKGGGIIVSVHAAHPLSHTGH
jgi:hypothetical protein